jgi:hippurate hydrolase
MLLNVRTYDPAVRERPSEWRAPHRRGRVTGVRRTAPPGIEIFESAPAVVSDEAATRARPALESVVEQAEVVDPGPVTGSEDVGILAAGAGAPCVFWLLGGADPGAFAEARDLDGVRAVMTTLPSNHSPAYAPVIDPTLRVGVQSLVAAAQTWLDGD